MPNNHRFTVELCLKLKHPFTFVTNEGNSVPVKHADYEATVEQLLGFSTPSFLADKLFKGITVQINDTCPAECTYAIRNKVIDAIQSNITYACKHLTDIGICKLYHDNTVDLAEYGTLDFCFQQ